MAFSRNIFQLLLTVTAVPLLVSAETHFCGETEYDLDKKLCCNSNLFQLIQDGQIVKCCSASGKIYKPGSEICCGDVYNRASFQSRNFTCCGDRPIITGTETCCGGKKIPSGRGCCGDRSYDLAAGRCCGDQLFTWRRFKGNCCANQSYNNRSHYCYESNSFIGVLPINISRCGNININITTHTCCDEETPVAITGYRGAFPPVCCNKTVIPNKNRFHCVKNHLLPINQDLCPRKTENGIENIPYSPSTEWCCNGTVVAKNRTLGRNETCCSTGVIDLSTQKCCANKHPYSIFDYCCGETVVNSKEMCCGRTVLNDNQVCCKEANRAFPVTKRKRFHDDCCNGQSYQRASRPCVLPTKSTPQCGREPWDPNRDSCCNNRLYKGKKGKNFRCCGGHLLNTDYQECIHSRPRNRTTSTPPKDSRTTNRPPKDNNKFCRKGTKKRKIRKRIDQCCSNRFYKNARRNGLSCCGAGIYNKTSHKCCFNKPVPLNSTICNIRVPRHGRKNASPLMCSSQDWLRIKALPRMDCIEHAYIMQRKSRKGTYRIRKDLAKTTNKGQKRKTWNTKPFCNQVVNEKSFIFITTRTDNYVVKNKRKSRKDIKMLPVCGTER
ncbi:uncharacterized protein [Argopecten irradians]|uniref:uncharacterized protein isoform X2 n=1 Tax=Argopecten irradians TaxID=31199 RepID=UPI0037232992